MFPDLKYSVADFRLLADNAPVGIFLTTVDGQWRYANEALAHMLEFDSPRELMRESALERYHQPGARAALLERLHNGEQVRNAELELRTRNGAVRTVLSSMNLEGDRITGMMIDVTDRKQAEVERVALLKQLAQERALLAEVLQQMPLGVGIATAPKGTLILGNAQLETIWRHPMIPADTIAGYDVYHGFHLDGRPLLPEEWPLARAIRTGEVVSPELIAFERGDGSHGLMEMRAAPVRDDMGTVVAGVVTFDDVTARERAARDQQFLSEASALLASSLDYDATLTRVARLSVPRLADWCLVHMVDTDGIARIVAFEHADPRQHELRNDLEQWYTLAPGAPSHIAQVLRSGKPILISEIREEHLAATAVDEQHLAALHKLGMRSGLIVPLIVQQTCVGALTLIVAESGRSYDSTDLALAEEVALRAAQAITHARLYAAEQQAHAEAEAAVRLRDEFLSVASHELQTPLTAMLGTVQLIQQRDSRENMLSERDRRSFAMVAAQSRRLQRLIANLLDVTRLTAGRLTLQLGSIDLGELVSRLVDELRLITTQHQIELDLPETPLILSGDMLRLEQVVANLLQNAIKYSPYGGVVKVQVEQRGAEAVLKVTDQGIGIPAAALPNLFTRYYRAPNTATARISGLGIGLFVVKEIVEAHGGTVSVSSDEGYGSCFTVTLPQG